jgi:hypothetical protein
MLERTWRRPLRLRPAHLFSRLLALAAQKYKFWRAPGVGLVQRKPAEDNGERKLLSRCIS